MGKKLYIILGNGFTIDFLNSQKFGKNIDVRNFFADGAYIPWPSNEMPGFLSSKNCPNLWTLGARPFMSADESGKLIETIITCVNVYTLKDKKQDLSKTSQPNDIYIRAYKELLLYIKYLFVYYNNMVKDDDMQIDEWAWANFFKKVYGSQTYENIVIVTYNYDLWLERILKKLNIPHDIGVIQNTSQKIKIYKPHGSIGFVHKAHLDKTAFDIPYGTDLNQCLISELSIGYDHLDDHYAATALIPPAGESERFSCGWAGEIRKEIKKEAERITNEDKIILCGLSYWHVDRAELDEIFLAIDSFAEFVMIDPKPNKCLDAVLGTMFSNYIYYPDSKILKEIII
ncbi:MAG: hypothetical protein PHQ00_02255 [Phycisphaerae bacterium]|nr:hypothetical protein [Phycisphaerae bacterium]